MSISDSYTYIIDKSMLGNLSSLYSFLELNYRGMLKDTIQNGRYPFNRCVFNFNYPSTLDIVNVVISKDLIFHIDVLWGDAYVYSSKVRVVWDESDNKVCFDVISLLPKGKGINLVKGNKGSNWVFRENLNDFLKHIFCCLVLTALKSTFYVDSNKSYCIGKDCKVCKIDSSIYRLVDLGKHKRTKTKSTKKGRKHSYEYPVIGHWRRLKSGKLVWVKPYIRCKGRGLKQSSTLVDFINVDKAIEKEVVK